MKRTLLLSLALAGLTSAANAAVFTFMTPGGSQDAASEKVSASVTFTTGTNTLSISLSNLLTAAEVKSVGQNLSDIFFDLNNVKTGGSVGSSNSTFVSVGTGGVVTSDVSGASGPNFMGWGLTNNGSGEWHLNGLGGSETPENTIIGGTAGSFTAYSNANASIKNNGPHNPFAQGTATWVLNISGINSDTRVTGAVFSFGTTAGDNVPGTPTPEPASMAVLGIGALALIRKRRKA